MACQLANNWVHAATAPLAVIALALVRPWRRGGDDRPPWRDRALARRWAVHGLAAFAVFCAFAASSVTWLASDAKHHALMPSHTIELQRQFYIERSPFLFANRDGVLAPWLETHAAALPVAARSPTAGTRYLGGVLVAVIALGAWMACDAIRCCGAGRRSRASRGCSSTGSRSDPGRCCGRYRNRCISGPRRRRARLGAARGSRAVRARGRRARAGARFAPRAAISRALALLAALCLLSHRVALERLRALAADVRACSVHPVTSSTPRRSRSSLLFAACLAALARRSRDRRSRTRCRRGRGRALVVDYAPSTRSFAEGEPLARAARVGRARGRSARRRRHAADRARPGVFAALELAARAVARGPRVGMAALAGREILVGRYAMAAFGGDLATGRARVERALCAAAARRARALCCCSRAARRPARPVAARAQRRALRALGAARGGAARAGLPRVAVWDGDDAAGRAAAADALRANALLVARPTTRRSRARARPVRRRASGARSPVDGAAPRARAHRSSSSTRAPRPRSRS